MDLPPQLAETTGCLCLASRRAARAITQRFDQALRPHGLRATQFTLLAVLALRGPQPVGTLADIIGADRTTLSRNLAAAGKQSLVSMGPGEDGRAHVASITGRGRQALRRALGSWQRTQADLTEVIGNRAADGLRLLARKPSIRNASREKTA